MFLITRLATQQPARSTELSQRAEREKLDAVYTHTIIIPLHIQLEIDILIALLLRSWLLTNSISTRELEREKCVTK